MSMCSLPVQEAINSLLRDGFYSLDDELLGTQISKFQVEGFLTHTAAGAEFLIRNTQESKGIKELCKSILGEPPWWGFIKIYGSLLPSDYVYRFLPGSRERISAVTILLCSPDSEFVFWKGSTTIGIDKNNERTTTGSPITCIREDEEDKAVSKMWGLLAIKEQRFREVRVYDNVIALKLGGLVLADCRLGFQIRRGYAIFNGFATLSQVRSWGQMKMTYSDELNDKLEELRRRGHHINSSWQT